MNIQKTDWLETECPICHKKFQYLVAYKPNTCGKWDCLYQFHHKEAIERKQRLNGEKNE